MKGGFLLGISVILWSMNGAGMDLNVLIEKQKPLLYIHEAGSGERGNKAVLRSGQNENGAVHSTFTDAAGKELALLEQRTETKPDVITLKNRLTAVADFEGAGSWRMLSDRQMFNWIKNGFAGCRVKYISAGKRDNAMQETLLPESYDQAQFPKLNNILKVRFYTHSGKWLDFAALENTRLSIIYLDKVFLVNSLPVIPYGVRVPVNQGKVYEWGICIRSGKGNPDTDTFEP